MNEFSAPNDPNGQPQITVCVPVYNSSRIVTETLCSIHQQTFRDFKVLISVDQSNDQSFDVVQNWCAQYGGGAFHCYRQLNRLGWVDNINFLFHKCKSPYVCMIPHDDLIHKEYLEQLLHCLYNNKNASIAFSDIETFGNCTHAILEQGSLRGTKYERVIAFLKFHYNAVAFRGLVRCESVGDRLFLSHNRHRDFSLDTIWVLQMALKGEILRVPEVLYKKRYIDASAHWNWQQWDDNEKEQAWMVHCQDCIELLWEDGFSEKEWSGIMEACQQRLFQEDKALWSPQVFRQMTDEDKIAMLESFLISKLLPNIKLQHLRHG